MDNRIWRNSEGSMELRLGRWQDVLVDVRSAAAMITDPPYTPRVHEGYRKGKPRSVPGVSEIPYPVFTEEEASELIDYGLKIIDKWLVVFNDHIGYQWLSTRAVQGGWYSFAPVIWIRKNSKPRYAGDGPSSDCDYIMVARPRKTMRPGSLPGHYISKFVNTGSDEYLGLTGQKPLDVMRAIIRNYTTRGDRILDPYAGTGTTLLAAAMEGRRGIGAECNKSIYLKAIGRLSGGYNLNLFSESP
jgi:site-specific DNA-methyltransferase (adenine-specific)